MRWDKWKSRARQEAEALQSLAGLQPSKATTDEVIRTRPRTPEERDDPRKETLCGYLLRAADDRPKTDEEYEEFARLARFFLDEAPLRRRGCRGGRGRRAATGAVRP